MFRSTGSYEPDQNRIRCFPLVDGFDPQALTSLTSTWCLLNIAIHSFDPQALTSLTRGDGKHFFSQPSFDPQALTSLTGILAVDCICQYLFRSTGSYEPDRQKRQVKRLVPQFRSTGSYEPDL